MHYHADVIHVEKGDEWNRYVKKHPKATPYHFFQWLQIITSIYGHKTYPLAAVKRHSSSEIEFVGILPLVHMKDPLWGSRLVSMPFFDHGGIIADSPEIEMELIKSAIVLAKKLKALRIELRHLGKLACASNTDLNEQESTDRNGIFTFETDQRKIECIWSLKTNKVRMILDLPKTSELLIKSFKSKLRSQIKKPMKAGLSSRIGGIELLDDFYQVFSLNMRDLGSPVHGKAFFDSILKYFKDGIKVFVVYKKKEPVAGSIAFGFKNLIANPWASSLRKFSKDSPNMLLYWKMLSYAADHCYDTFDFGRSTPDEGTYRFKSQWGCRSQPMYWYTFWMEEVSLSKIVNDDIQVGKSREIAETLWRRLPEPVARFIGPKIRKHIEL